MMVERNSKRGVSILACAALCIVSIKLIAAPASDMGLRTEYLSDGGFELGVIDVDVIRFPRYLKPSSVNMPKPSRNEKCAIAGRAGLQLPRLAQAVYRLESRAFPLSPGRKYTLSFKVSSQHGKYNATVEIFSGKWKRVYQRAVTGKPGVTNYEASFTASEAPVSTARGSVSHYFRIRLNAGEDLCVDDMSFRGPKLLTAIQKKRKIWVEPDRVLGVYPLGDQAHATVRVKPCSGCVLKYEIIDVLASLVLDHGNINTKTNLKYGVAEDVISLPTETRGYFKINLTLSGPDGNVVDMLDRSFAVINPLPGSLPGDKIFGLSMEEYGVQPQIYAATSPDELYGLAQAIGVRSVRVFSSASPANVSGDGKNFRLSQLKEAIAIPLKYGIDPMLELGTNDIFNAPQWLLSSDPAENKIDLLGGSALKSDEARLKRRNRGQYFDLEKYKVYLRAVFNASSSKISAYELWNEPGHKLSVDDIIRIAKLTRQVQQELDPSAVLVGFSSTARRDLGKGKDPKHDPSFISNVIEQGGLKYIDVLSYHSGHAFLFNDEHPDYRDQETGFVDRLRRLLAKAGKPDMPIWDTERGVPWKAEQKFGEMDYAEGSKRWEYALKSGVEPMEVARRLPMIYAAAIADGVERLFWFNMDGSGNGLRKTNFRWSVFAGLLEPAPQVVAYDAMTELLGGATYEKRINTADGARAYYFRRNGRQIVLVYNLKGDSQPFAIQVAAGKRFEVFDLMGRLLETKVQKDDSVASIEVGKWPKYIYVGGGL